MTSEEQRGTTTGVGLRVLVGFRPKILDLFGGAGGAARGYQLAGFYVVGVDLAPQPRYAGDAFIQADALTFPLDGFAAIHASPPCQRYSAVTPASKRREHPDLIGPIRERILATGLPYVIENVAGAPLINPFRLCGSSFGLPLQRHRYFESNVTQPEIRCEHHDLPKNVPIFRHGKWYLSRFVNVYGTGGGKAADRWAEAMGIDWMTRPEMAEAIPPAFTEFIGIRLRQAALQPAAQGEVA